MSGTGFTRFEDEIPANKQESSLNEATRKNREPISAKEIRTESERTRHEIGVKLGRIKEERTNAQKFLTEDEMEVKNKEHVNQMKQGIDHYLESIQKGILSKQNHIGSGLICVYCVRFHPSGKSFAFASFDLRGLRYYSSETHKMLWFSEAFDDSVTSLQFFGKGDFILTGCYDKLIRAFDSKTGALIKSVDLSAAILGLSINKAETMVAAGTTVGTVILISWPKGVIEKTIQCHGDYVRDVVFDYKGAYLASASDDKRWCLINVNTKEVEMKSEENYHDGYIYSIAFSPDDRYLATGAGDNKLKIYDLEKKSLSEFNPEVFHENSVKNVRFGRTAKTLVSCSAHGDIKIWDTTGKGKEVGTILVEKYKELTSVDISPDESKIIASSAKQIFLYDARTKREIRRYFSGFEEKIEKSLFNSDASLVVSLSIDENSIRIHDAKTGEEVGEPMKLSNLDEMNKPILDENGSEVTLTYIDFSVQILNFQMNRSRFCASYYRSDNKFGIICFESDKKEWEKIVQDKLINVRFSFDGSLIFGGTENGKIYVFENLNGDTRTIYEELPISSINDLVISANGSLLVFGGNDTDRLFSYETKNEKQTKKNVKEWRVSHSKYVKRLAISPNENYLASLDNSQVLLLSDLRKQEQIFDFGRENGNSVAFSADSKRLFAAGYVLNVYDVESGIKLLDINYRNHISHIQFSQDGTLLLTAGQFNVIEIFKMGSGEEDRKYFGNNTFVIEKIVYNKAEDKYAFLNSIREFKIFDARRNKEIPNSGKTFMKQPVDFIFDENEQTVLFVGDDLTLCKLSNFSKLDEIKMLDPSPDNSTVRTALFLKRSDRIAIGSHDGKLRLLNAKLEVIKEADAEKKHSDWIRKILSHPSKPEIFSASDDRSVKVWKEDNLDLLRTIIPGHTSYITCFVLSLDGNTLYTGGNDNNFFLTDANVQSTENAKFKLTDGAFHSSALACMELNSKGDQLLSISSDGAAKVWKVSQKGLELLRDFKFTYGCRCKFSKDGSKILSASGGDIHSLNLSSGECERKITGEPQNTIQALYLSSDESKLLVAEYNMLSLVQTKDFEILAKIELSNYISNFDIFREENKFAVCFYSGEIKVYDFDNLKLLRTLTIPAGDGPVNEDVKNIKFLSPGKLLLMNTSLRIFDVSRDSPTLLKRQELEKPVDKYEFFFRGAESKVAFTSEHIINCYSLEGPSGELGLTAAFKPVVGDSSGVLYTTLNISPDGERIYLLSHVTYNQNKIIVVDAFSGYIIKTHLIQNDFSVIKGSFSPDCNTFAFWQGSQLLVLDTDVFVLNIASNENLVDVQSVIFTKDSKNIFTASNGTRISVLDAEASSVMNDFYILNEKCKMAEKDPAELEKLDINQILNKRINIFTLVGRKYPLNVLHYFCLYNFEKVLNFVLKNVNKDNSDLLYALLNHRDFIDHTPYEMAVMTGYVYIIETLIKVHLKTKRQSRFISNSPFQSQTLNLVLNYYPEYLTKVLDSQLCSSNQRKVVKLPFNFEYQTFLPNYQSKFQHKDVIEADIYQGGGKKIDFSCKVLVIEDILNPKNKFLKQLSETLGESHDVFESDALKAVLQFKWDAFGRKKFVRSACKYFFYFILVVIASLILFPMWDFFSLAPDSGFSASLLENILKGNLNPETSRPSHPADKYNQKAVFIASIVFDVLILLYLLIAILPYEAKQIGIKRLGYFKERIWNVLDFLLIVVGTGSMIFHILVITETVEPEIKVVRALKVLFFLNLLITWLRMAEFLRGSRLTAGLLRFLTRVSYQMKPFFIVLFYFLIGIGLSTFLLQNNYEQYGRWDFLMMFYNIILGHKDEFEMMSHTTSVFEDLFFIVFFLTTIFLVMIMLNLLIAIVLDIHSMVVAVEGRAFQYERLNLIIEYEETMSPNEAQIMMSFCEGTFLYAIRSTKESRDYDEEDSTDPEKRSRREKIDKIYTEVSSNAQSVKGLAEDNKAIMEIMNEKFQQIERTTKENFEELKNHLSEELKKSKR